MLIFTSVANTNYWVYVTLGRFESTSRFFIVDNFAAVYIYYLSVITFEITNKHGHLLTSPFKDTKTLKKIVSDNFVKVEG